MRGWLAAGARAAGAVAGRASSPRRCRPRDVDVSAREAPASRSRALGDERVVRDAARRAAPGGELRLHARAARRGRAPLPRAARGGGRRGGARAPAGALPARRDAGSSTSRTTPTARARSRRRLDDGARTSGPCVALLCVLGDKDWRAMIDALAPVVGPLRPHRCAHRAGDRARGRSPRRVALRRGARATRAEAHAGLRRGAASAADAAGGPRSSRAHSTPSATRWRGCRCLRSPAKFRGCSRAPSPAFATSIRRSSPSARSS